MAEIHVSRYMQDGVRYICAGDASTPEAIAREAADDRLGYWERLADDMVRIDGRCTWVVTKRPFPETPPL